MITLPKLLVSATDITHSGPSAKSGGKAAQDFFALLSGAVSGKNAKGAKPTLTLAQLHEVSQKLPQGETKATLDKLLAQQEGDDKPGVDLTKLTDPQSVLSALTPEARSDVLKQLTKDLKESDAKPSDSEEELAGISALMAMLPHNTTALPTVAPTEQVAVSGMNSKTAATDLASAVNSAIGNSTEGKTAGKELSFAQTVQTQHEAVTDNATLNQAPPLTTAAAAKADADSTLSAAPTVNIAPVISQATATVNTHPVVTVNSQLGTPEWQQNVSQHITLFTRQGQQTAELKLHPENLGQVNITLKIDDNQAQIQMVSPHSHVRAALEAAIPVLRTQLADNGIQLSQSNVSSESFAGQQQHSSFGQSSSQRSTEGHAFAADDDETLSVPATLQSQARGNGIVDTFA